MTARKKTAGNRRSSECIGGLGQLAVPGFDGEVWTARLDVAANRLPKLSEFLSPDELTRAESLHTLQDRNRFMIARGYLRVLLGRHLGVRPQAIVFAYGERGKPYVLSPAARIHFNVSHSGECALYVVSIRGPVGVDVECLGRELPWRRLAQRFFSAREAAALQRLPKELQKHAFLACWTRKEALAKAIGEGLVAANSKVSPGWALYTPKVRPGYVATVATFRPNRD
jgi:4'-phosphopantetheinyl transferase